MKIETVASPGPKAYKTKIGLLHYGLLTANEVHIKQQPMSLCITTFHCPLKKLFQQKIHAPKSHAHGGNKLHIKVTLK